jgi:hypothetical protein
VKLLGRPTNGVLGDAYRVGGPPYSYYRATWAQDLNNGYFFAKQDNFYEPDKLASSSLAITDGQTIKRGERRAGKEWQFYSPPDFEWPIVSTLNEWIHLGSRPFEGHNRLSELLVPEYASIRKDEQVQGHHTFVVDLRRPLDPVYYARIWIDRTRGVPLRLDYYHEPPGVNSTKSARVDSIKLFRLPNNGWIPIAGRRTVFFPQGAQTDDIEVNINTITTRAQDIPESLFKDVP